jgi:hypothetical protein
MRKDMAKVIVERPRVGSRLPSRKKGYRKFLQNTSPEDLPRREPMLGRWRGMQRFLNEHLGPMQRFLRSRVGRPWNKVHAELCEHVSFDNPVQKHVLTHVFEFVHREVVESEGKIFAYRRWSGRRYPLTPGDMYVCPRTGILRVVRRRQGAGPRIRINVNKLLQYHRRDGQWWEVRLRARPSQPGEAWEPWLELPVAQVRPERARDAYGAEDVVALSKRLLPPIEASRILRSARERS